MAKKKIIRDPFNYELGVERRQRKYEYHRQHYTLKPVTFSDNNPEEAEMLEWISGMKGYAAYVKSLIHADMRRKQQEASMKRVSLDHGQTFVSPEEAVQTADWGALVDAMEDAAYAQASEDLATKQQEQFLKKYLVYAESDLIL